MPETQCGGLQVVPQFDPQRVAVDCLVLDQNVVPEGDIGVEVKAINRNKAPAAVEYGIFIGATNQASGVFSVPAEAEGSDTVTFSIEQKGNFDIEVRANISRA